jgi:hypothetical protein
VIFHNVQLVDGASGVGEASFFFLFSSTILSTGFSLLRPFAFGSGVRG